MYSELDMLSHRVGMDRGIDVEVATTVLELIVPERAKSLYLRHIQSATMRNTVRGITNGVPHGIRVVISPAKQEFRERDKH
jgi:hypothetical protein